MRMNLIPLFGVLGQGIASGIVDRHQARLAELGLADEEHLGVQVHVIEFERQRFARSQAGGSHEADEGRQGASPHAVG